MTSYTLATPSFYCQYLTYRWIPSRTQIKELHPGYCKSATHGHSQIWPEPFALRHDNNQKFVYQWVKLQLRNRWGFTWNKCTMQISTFVTNVEQGPRHGKFLVFTRRERIYWTTEEEDRTTNKSCQWQSVDVNKNHQEVFKSELPGVGFLVSQMEML